MIRNYELIPKDVSWVDPNQEPVRAVPFSASEAKRLSTSEQPGDLDVDIHGLLQAILRRRKWIYFWTVAMIAAAGLVCLLMTPQYEAESKLQILKQDTSGLSLGQAGATAETSSDPLDFNVNLQTQLGVLRSDTLAWKVMRELKLVDVKASPPDPLSSGASGSTQQTEPSGPVPGKEAALALKSFNSNLTVNAVPGTRLISVSYMHPDPNMSARIVNQLVSDFVEYNFQVRYNATAKATDWLRSQLVDLKAQVEKSQDRAVQLQKESGIFGQDEHHNIVLTRLEQLNNEVTSTEADRVMKENVYKLSRSGSPELVAGMLGAEGERNIAEGANSAALIHKLREQEATLNEEYAQASAKYGPAYPRLIQIKEKLNAVRSSIAAELRKVAEQARNDYQLAASREAAARKAFAEQKAMASEMNDKATNFLMAKHEAESSQKLYENLLEKLKEAGVLAGLHSSPVHVLDAAQVPRLPARPNVPLYLGLGGVAGLFFGLVSVFVVESMDRTIRDVGKIETATYVPVLGVIPDARRLQKTGIKQLLKTSTREAPKEAAQAGPLSSLQNGAVVEAFRAVRTSLLLSGPETSSKVFVVTSAMPQEGKSFISLNLAVAFANNGCKVLLVDADLRRASLSRVLGAFTGAGLSDVLRKLRNSGDVTAEQVLNSEQDGSSPYRQIERVPGLTFMPAGDCPHHASELLGSQQMSAVIDNWRNEFDCIVIDTPPAVPVTDAVVLSRKVDSVIVAVRFAVTSQPSILRTVRLLRDVQAARIGLLVNAMDVRAPEYHQYSGSRGVENYYQISGNSQSIASSKSQTDKNKRRL